MSPYTQIIYCSRRTISEGEAAEAEIRDILTVARDVNGREGITGAMMLNAHCFAQVLEGLTEPVKRVFEGIRRDPRHRDVTLLSVLTVEERMFPDWSMGFTSPEDEDEIGIASSVFSDAFASPDEASALATRDLVERTIAKVQLW